MVSIKDVAKIAGVSTATVSRYLNTPEALKGPTRDKVRKTIAEVGYAPNALARNFRRGKTHLVMVVLPSVGDPFFEGIMAGIWRVAKQQNYTILVRETQFNTVDFDQFSKMIFSKEADGIILLASVSPFDAAAAFSPNQKVPPIVLSCENVTSELSKLPSVRIDNVAAAKEATHYLINLGHRKIAFIYGKSGSTLTYDRERGYRQAMQEAGLTVDEGWLAEGELNLTGARRATRRLLNHTTPPTAIFCGNDEMAIGATHEIKISGLKVPDDISIVGFDDIRYAEVMDPPLTTIAQPAEEIGELTMYRLCTAMSGADIGFETETVPHKLVVRRSAAPPK